MDKICGVYKITSPSNKVYIGSSKDITWRWVQYKYKSKTKSQPRIQNSFDKYGYKNHVFEIIEECEFDQLFIRERYWQEFYDVLSDEKGLNCSLVNTLEKPQIRSEKTRLNMSKAQKGKKLSLERIEAIRISSTGRKHSELSKLKMSLIQNKKVGKFINQYNLSGIFLKKFKSVGEAAAYLGDLKYRKHNRECCQKKAMSAYGFMWKYSDENLKELPCLKEIKYQTINYKKVIQYDLNMNIIKEYRSTKEACDINNIKISTLKACLTGHNKTCNKYIWKYK